MMKPINGNGNVENATATIGKVGGSGDCFFPSLETHKDVRGKCSAKLPSDMCKVDEDGI